MLLSWFFSVSFIHLLLVSISQLQKDKAILSYCLFSPLLSQYVTWSSLHCTGCFWQEENWAESFWQRWKPLLMDWRINQFGFNIFHESNIDLEQDLVHLQYSLNWLWFQTQNYYICYHATMYNVCSVCRHCTTYYITTCQWLYETRKKSQHNCMGSPPWQSWLLS